MITETNNNQRYFLAIGYGDYEWDLGEDEYWSDSLEELWEEVSYYTNLSFDEFIRMMDEDGYAEDDEEMWYVVDKTRNIRF